MKTAILQTMLVMAALCATVIVTAVAADQPITINATGRWSGTITNFSKVPTVETLQAQNMELQRENGKLRQQLEAAKEEHRQVARNIRAQYSREMEVLIQSNVTLRATIAKGSK